jgi:hypothetical protein
MILRIPDEKLMRGVVAGLAVAAALAGCATTRPGVPVAPLELIQSGSVVLPAGCVPGSGVVYRTAFVVQPDGRVEQIAAQSGSGCVQQALQDWVATFKYRPVAEATSTVVDWMAVAARRGG